LEINKKKEIWEVHNNTKWAHPGVRGTWFACLQDLNFRPTRSQIKDIVERCQRCKRFKADKKKTTRPARIFENPGEAISVDITGPFEYDKKKYWITVLIDRYSRYVWASLSNKAPTSMEFTLKVIETTIDTRVTLKSVLSDNRPRFRGLQWQNLCNKLKIRKHLASNHYPKTDGKTERSIQSVKQKLRLDDQEGNLKNK
jgi:transposase InsO family protein